MSEEPNVLPWYGIYVKPRHEKHVALTLKRKGFESFLPTYTKSHKNRKSFEVPLFPTYVFCRINLLDIRPVVVTESVISIVGNGSGPAPIPESEIEQVRRIAGSGLVVRTWPYVSEGQEVCLQSGPLQGVRGHVLDASNEKWLVVSIHILQRSVAVRFDRTSLRPGEMMPVRERPIASQHSRTPERRTGYAAGRPERTQTNAGKNARGPNIVQSPGQGSYD